MNVVILAGGFGSRLAEETHRVPKPMVEIGGRPMLWHIMNIYAAAGHADFIVACGYKGEVIKDYFDRFTVHNSDWKLDLATGRRENVRARLPDWRVSLVDTGYDTKTGGRLRRVKDWIGSGTFLATYGDGLANADFAALVEFHRRHGRLATVTAVHPPARFGALDLDGPLVREFSEKPQGREGWINGGFFVFEPAVLDRIPGDESSLEHDLLRDLAAAGELAAFRHEGFWHPMDTLRDRQQLDALWAAGTAPWKRWAD